MFLALLITACSPGTDTAPAPDASGAAAAPSKAATVCGAVVDVSSVIGDGLDLEAEPPTPEQLASAFQEYKSRLEPPLSAIEKDPPAGLEKDIGTVARQARYAIQNNDRVAIETDEFESATDRLQAYIVRECGYPVVRVFATEYAYQGIPPTLAQGTAVFILVNQGVEPHELTVYRIDDDVQQPMTEIVTLPDAQRAAILDDAASVFANPASDDTEFVALIPGRYGVACFEPRGSTADRLGTGPPHALSGMVTEFTVA